MNKNSFPETTNMIEIKTLYEWSSFKCGSENLQLPISHQVLYDQNAQISDFIV